MKRRFMVPGVLGSFLVIAVSGVARGQVDDVDRQILLMVQRGSIQLTTGLASADILGLQVDEDLRQVLLTAGVNVVRRVIPEFTELDTLQLLTDGRIYRPPDFTNLYILELPGTALRDSTIARLNRLPAVIYAERNMRVYPRGERIPQDQYFYRQWNMKNTGLYGGSPGSDVKATYGWDRTTGSAATSIAVIDGGIEANHPDLLGRIVGDSEVGDHGTMVTGVAAATGDNTLGNGYIGVAGMDWNAEVINESYDLSSLIAAINSAVQRGARAINCSWGVDGWYESLRSTFIAAHAADVMIIVANPQTTTPLPWPNNYGSFMHNVAATNWTDHPTNYLVATEFTDVAAPGGEPSVVDESEIYTTMPGASWGYTYGTSFAAPHSTGMAALMLALNPSLHNYDMEWLQKKTADNGGVYQFGLYGHGRINADSALELLQSPYELTQGSASLSLPPGWSNIQTTWLTSPNPWMDEEDYLPAGIYLVDRYVLEANITFPEPYDSPPLAWLSQTGYSAANPNNPSSYHFQYQYENVTTGSMSVKTFFYYFKYRLPYQGPINMWIPHNPFQLAAGHSRVGVPDGGGGPELPSAPTDLSGWYDRRFTVVHLQWDRNPPSENVDKYWLECAEEEGEFDVVAKGIPDPGSGSWVTYDHYIWEYQEAEYLRYRVRAHNSVGWGPFCDPIEVPLDIGPLRAMDEAEQIESAPKTLTLEANFPNPFNPDTQIRFGLPTASRVNLVIYNIRGQVVRTLVEQEMTAGWHTVTWDGKNEYGRDVASGIYLYILQAEGERILRKMTLIR